MMLKLVIFGALLSTISAAGQCYHEGYKMTALTVGTGEAEVDMISTVPESEKAYNKETVKTCPDGETCFSYTVSATANIAVPESDSVPGIMKFEAQSCMDDDVADSETIGEAICNIWKVELEKDEELGEIASGLETSCGAPTMCIED
ncbi:hypothetical protein ACHWQZ_G016331, partial [Mnemiopsis leidyi]